MAKSINFTLDKLGVARLVFDLKGEKVNKLSSDVLLELEQILDKAKRDSKIRVLVFSSAKENIFIAGADIGEIKEIKDEKEAIAKVTQGQNILNKIADLPFPTIAYINGACLGGGLELALSCTYRIATKNDKTKLGLPEVSLGIIPGFGGTQRLPKLVGLAQSLSMILPGKPIDALKAYRVGLVDEVTREEFALDLVNKFIVSILEKPETNQYLQKRTAAQKSRFIKERLLLGQFLIFQFAKKDLIKKTKGQYPAPLAALEVIKETYNFGPERRAEGLKIEVDSFAKLVVGNICKNLIDLFFTSEEIKKDSGVGKSAEAIAVKNTGLIGAGIMGGGIAWLFSNYGFAIRMKDISNKAIALGFNQVYKVYGTLKKIGKVNDNQINLKVSNITSTLDYKGFESSDLVIEAIIEDINIKKSCIADLEKYVTKECIIASNTSSLSISEMAAALKKPERFVGMHFFNPVDRMPLVEVIQGKKTSARAVATIVALSKKLGKTPIVVKDVPGFLVNRILIPYINEAGFLVEDGANLQLVDSVIENFGMPMGPFTLADTVGIDVGYKVAKILEKGYGPRMKVCNLLEKIAKDKELLGKKSGQGFFKYDENGKKDAINDKISMIIDSSSKKEVISQEEIIDRCILIMVNEAAKCLEEGVIKNPRYLDMAMIMGTGFPPYRGGLLKYVDDVGVDVIVKKLKALSKKRNKRFEPAALLVSMLKGNKKFY